MAEEMKKVDIDELDEVSGGKSGKHGHRESISDVCAARSFNSATALSGISPPLSPIF